MTYKDCKEKLDFIKSDVEEINKIKQKISDDIDEIFIASSNRSEMDYDLFIRRDFNLPENLITSQKKEYALWVISSSGIISRLT